MYSVYSFTFSIMNVFFIGVMFMFIQKVLQYFVLVIHDIRFSCLVTSYSNNLTYNSISIAPNYLCWSGDSCTAVYKFSRFRKVSLNHLRLHFMLGYFFQIYSPSDRNTKNYYIVRWTLLNSHIIRQFIYNLERFLIQFLLDIFSQNLLLCSDPNALTLIHPTFIWKYPTYILYSTVSLVFV